MEALFPLCKDDRSLAHWRQNHHTCCAASATENLCNNAAELQYYR